MCMAGKTPAWFSPILKTLNRNKKQAVSLAPIKVDALQPHLVKCQGKGGNRR